MDAVRNTFHKCMGAIKYTFNLNPNIRSENKINQVKERIEYLTKQGSIKKSISKAEDFNTSILFTILLDVVDINNLKIFEFQNFLKSVQKDTFEIDELIIGEKIKIVIKEENQTLSIIISHNHTNLKMNISEELVETFLNENKVNVNYNNKPITTFADFKTLMPNIQILFCENTFYVTLEHQSEGGRRPKRRLLKDHTLKELQQKARSRNIAYAGLKKADLIDALKRGKKKAKHT